MWSDEQRAGSSLMRHRSPLKSHSTNSVELKVLEMIKITLVTLDQD